MSETAYLRERVRRALAGWRAGDAHGHAAFLLDEDLDTVGAVVLGEVGHWLERVAAVVLELDIGPRLGDQPDGEEVRQWSAATLNVLAAQLRDAGLWHS